MFEVEITAHSSHAYSQAGCASVDQTDEAAALGEVMLVWRPPILYRLRGGGQVGRAEGCGSVTEEALCSVENRNLKITFFYLCTLHVCEITRYKPSHHVELKGWFTRKIPDIMKIEGPVIG